MKDTIKAATQALHRIQEQAARDKVKARKARTQASDCGRRDFGEDAAVHCEDESAGIGGYAV